MKCVDEKKNIRKILSSYFKNKKDQKTGVSLDKPCESDFMQEAKKKMKEVKKSYMSLMEVHTILVDVYKDILKKS